MALQVAFGFMAALVILLLTAIWIINRAVFRSSLTAKIDTVALITAILLTASIAGLALLLDYLSK